MAASVNNVAATFATVPILSSSSSSSSSLSSNAPLKQTSFALSASHKPISTSWNVHSSLPRSRRSSLLSLYGPPGPRPFQAISTVHGHHQIVKHQRPLSIRIGEKLPNAKLSFLDRNGKLQTVTVSSLCKGKRFVLVGVCAAFSPTCSRYVKGVEAVKSKGVDLIACVAVNDVFVMRAWGQHLAVGEKVMMLSDGQRELSRALGLCVDTSEKARLGLGVRSRRFCLSALNGVITNVCLKEEEEDDDVDFISTKVNGSLKIT